MSKQKSKKKVSTIIEVILFTVILVVAWHIYRLHNFNDLVKRQLEGGESKFSRDYSQKVSDIASYKVENINITDAMFCKKTNVEKDTVYKVKCKVKTENVESETTGGAQICIADTTEKSISISGTTDWQELEFMFNSKNRESIEIAFRLGGYNTKCSGTAWFADFSLEKGEKDTSKDWKFACFVFPNLDVTLNINDEEKQFDLKMNNEDISEMKENMERFKNSISELTEHKINSTYDFITVEETIKTLSYDEENGYYVSPGDVEKILYPYITNKEYDYIFICVKMGDVNKDLEVPVNDWIGLGGMDYLGIGFSNIRLPNNKQSYIYKYKTAINTFPEEVFVHEFIHTLERNAKEYGNDIIALHDYEKYGYKEQPRQGLKKWYYDYMNKIVGKNNEGLPEEVFAIKPVKSENFNNSQKIDVFREPKNIIEEVQGLFEQIKLLFKAMKGE